MQAASTLLPAMHETAPRREIAAAILLAAVAACPRHGAAGEPPSAIIAEFTRSVQPLLLNRCATGGCHGGNDAGSLRFIRHDFTGRITRDITLANLDAVLRRCGPERSPTSLIMTVSGRHPASATTPRERTQPLTPRERATLEHWLSRALAANTFGPTASAVPAPRSRLQSLLDTKANPPALPPPQEPHGLILK